jgi:gliding motility-associated-like protein
MYPIKKRKQKLFSMKQILFFIWIFSCNPIIRAQSYWINQAGNTGVDEALDISSDANNNNYTIGYFSNAISFGGTTLTSYGINDCYVTKSDVNGAYVWAIKLGGTNVDKGLSIKTDAEGNSVICGLYSATATFGLFTIISQGLQDGFIAKISTTGIVLWVKSVGGAENDIANAVNFDNDGNVIVTGQFKGTAQFGGTQLVSAIDPVTLTSSIDIFTFKLNSTGEALWAKQGKAKYTDRGIDVALDNSGNVYVTGQFSDTIMFDQTYNNVASNSIFLVKYNSSGAEQWFRRIGGSTLNVVSGIAIDDSDNILLTGDFAGAVTFFGATDVVLNSAYNNGVFIAKYTNQGSIVWTKSSGSDSYVSSKNIVLDASSNSYITGNFECKLNAFANEYGQGTFNSIGKKDVFTAKFSSAGNFEWARSCGGLEDESSFGITINNADNPIIAGSYSETIIFPFFTGFDVISSTLNQFSNNNNTYCGDANYGSFASITSFGSIDLFIGSFFELSRLPFDYYVRNISSACNPDYVGVCIAENNVCIDTVEACGSANLGVTSNTYPSPNFNYLWSTGSTSPTTSVSAEGDYWVKQTTVDGCFMSYDTVHVVILPLPEPISISDSKGININDFTPQEIKLCDPDSVTLTAGNTDPYEVTWSNNLLPGNTTYAFVSGQYQCSYVNENGCGVSNSVNVEIVPYVYPVPVFEPVNSENDTITICGGTFIQLALTDSLSEVNLCDPSIGNIIGAEFMPMIDGGFSNCVVYFSAPEDGYYTIEATYLLDTYCQTDTFYASQTVYVEILELPEVALEITGESFFCFGDTITLTVNCTVDGYEWSGPSYISSPYDSIIYAITPGNYSASVTVTNEFGCSASAADNINLANTPTPIVSMNPPDGIICPNDSIAIFVNLTGTYDWYGPEGLLEDSAQVIYVTTSGFYFCVVTTPNDCEVSSNTVEVIQYTTPYLSVFPSAILCPDSSIEINVITTPNSNLQWQSPLSGGNLMQVIDQPGLYTCTVNACDISTTLSINIVGSFVEAVISTNDETVLCEGDSILLTANEGYSYQWQPNGQTGSSILVVEEGTYQLICTNIDQCIALDNIMINQTVIVPEPPISNNGPVCENEVLILSTSIFGNVSYFWSGPNDFTSLSPNPFIENVTELQEGLYTLVMQEDDCISDTVSTTAIIDPAFSLTDITSNFPICIGQELFLNVNFVEGAIYNWIGPYDFESTVQNPVHYFNAQDTGYYYLVATRGACKANEEIFIFGDDCNINTVNVFTPNGDGINDFFSFSKENLLDIDVDIYNRWGQLIYSWDNINGSWDGTILKSAKKASEGVYYYVAKLLPRNGYLQNVKGYLNLIY